MILVVSGGVRNRSGAIIDPNSGRSERRGINFRTLPHAGFQAEAPQFLLPDDTGVPELRDRELTIWREAWGTPQACAWIGEKLRWRVIAQYCRLSAIVELSIEPGPGLVAQLHRFRDQIGLTPAGLSENGWQIEPAPNSDGTPAVQVIEETKRPSSRSRLPSNVKVVKGGGR